MCKYYAVLYKGLEHLQILVFEGDPGTNPPQIPRDVENVIYQYKMI